MALLSKCELLIGKLLTKVHCNCNVHRVAKRLTLPIMRLLCILQEICSDPRMIVEKHDRFDVNQGELGNCWFLAALANLAENADRFNRVVPNGQEDFESKNYAGIFRFRFWKQLEWHEVVIDDRLPTRNGKLIYAHSDDHNEFWGALLEKAYAKYYGSYKSLEGGLALEAAVDFTGGIPEIYDCVGGDEEDPERLAICKVLRFIELNTFFPVAKEQLIYANYSCYHCSSCCCCWPPPSEFALVGNHL